MKPIRLEIEGINSYYKKQVIDFDMLTSRGIFGIFGKTGSGKSTILDAITLALYGNIARGTKEFINSNSDKAVVDYEFELGMGNERNIYRISRRFRKKKSGSKNTFTSDYVRLMKKSTKESEYTIIADKVGDVNKSIKDILGLEESDFLKSVVLPQGKFNEFLTLAGKDRRNMLERIFSLEEYGTILNIRLSKEKSLNNTEIQVLNGKLQEYPDVNLESKQGLEKSLSELKSDVESINKDINISNKQISDLESAILLFENKKIIEKEVLNHNSRKDEFEMLSKKLEKLSNAMIIIPEMEILKNAKDIILTKNIEKENQEKKYYEENGYLEKLKNEKLELSDLVSKLPNILLSSNEIDRLIEVIDLIKEKIDTKLKYESNLIQIEEEKKNISSNIGYIDKEICLIDDRLEELKSIIEQNKLDLDEKEIAMKNIAISELIIGLYKDSDGYLRENKKIENELVKLDSEKLRLDGELCKFSEDLSETILRIEDNKNEKSKFEEDVLSCSEKINSLEIRKTLVEQNERLLNSKKEEIKELKKSNETFNNEIKIAKNEVDRVSEEISILEEKIRNDELNNLSNKIRNSWINHFHSGDTCPVCNSSIKEISILEELENKEIDSSLLHSNKNEISLLEKLKSDLNDKNNSIISINSKIDFNINLIEKISIEIDSINELLNNDKSSELREKINSLKKDKELNEKNLLEINKELDVLEKDKNSIEKSMVDYDKKISNIKLNFDMNTKMSEDLCLKQSDIDRKINDKIEEYIEYNSINSKVDEKLNSLDSKINNYEYFVLELEKFNKKLELIKSSEKVVAQSNSNIEVIEKNRIELTSSNENNKKNLNDIETKIALNKQSINSINDEIEGFEEKYNSVSSNILLYEDDFRLLDTIISEETLNKHFENKDSHGLRQVKNSMLKKYSDIKERYENCTLKLDEKYIIVNEIKTSIEKLVSELKTNESFKVNQEKKINSLIEKYGFTSTEEVLDYKCEESELFEIKNSIELYKDKGTILKSKFEEINNKIKDNKYKDREEFLVSDLDNEKEKNYTLKESLEETKDSYSKIEHELIKMEKNLDLVKEILEKLEVCNKQKSNLDMLDKVLRGNKFVEYLSQIYLRNIVLDASKRLDYITKGRYSIEINSEYSFVIRDNFNGGIRRSADTLSGGETFLTSLSLALALSSQIQLKGSAPLEFFFLDEGFGTLDDELLDTVMESLEMLKSDTMSVGIISHVEELKNRVPVKLNIEMDNVNSTSVARIDIS